MSFSPSSGPLTFHFLVWSALRPDRANCVMILKTCEALARLAPSWTIDARFTVLPQGGAGQVLKVLGVDPPPNLRIGLLFPSRRALSDGHIHRVLTNPESPRNAHEYASWKEYWLREARARDTRIFYTRNPPLLPFLRSVAGDGEGPPVFLELHQLKYAVRTTETLEVEQIHAGVPGRGKVRDLLSRFRSEELRNLECADALFCISGPLAERVRRLGFSRPVSILRSAVSERLLAGTGGESHLAADSPQRDLDLLYTGQLYYWKGVHTVIEALRYCHPDVRLTVVGGNDPADVYYMRLLARNFGVADRITWAGQVPHGEVASYQRRARVGVVPLPRTERISRWYTSPIKVFEMMAAGLPLLVSDLPSLRDFLVPDQTAVFAPPNDPRAWGRAIDRLMEDAPLRERLATTAREQIGEFSFERRAQRIIEQVESHSAGRGAGT